MSLDDAVEAAWRGVAVQAAEHLESDPALMATHPGARQARDLLRAAVAEFDREGHLPVPVPVPSIARYRERHTITVLHVDRPAGPVTVCGYDGIRIHPRHGSHYPGSGVRVLVGWFHDEAELKRAAAQDPLAGAFPTP